MESVKHSLWVEKYRPTQLDNYIGNEHLKSKVSVYLESGDIHIYYYSVEQERVKPLLQNYWLIISTVIIYI